MAVHRASALALAVAAIGLMISTATLAAGSRGVTVKLKASEAANAADAGEIRLYESSHALVIGIDAYRDRAWPRLSKGVSDARAVAAALEERGFEVTLHTNLTGDGLEKAFEDFFIEKGRNREARLFVWFAGHGHTVDEEGYLIPANGADPRREEADFLRTALSLRRFGDYVRLAKSKHVMAVFDSCFAGTIFQVSRSRTPPAITRVTTEPVRQFLSSGEAGQQVSDDGEFASLFIDALKNQSRADANGDGYLTGSELGSYLTYEVSNVTNNVQTPRHGKLRSSRYNKGDFVFVLPGGAAAARGGGTTAQMVFWKSVESSDSGGDYCAYLETFPKGTFAALAKARAKQYGGACVEETQTASLTSPHPPFSVRDMDGLYVAVKRANVRAKPDATGPKLTTLDVGATVSVTGQVEGKDWYRIALADGTGFVWSPLLEDQEAYERKQEAERARAEAEQERLRVARLPKTYKPGNTPNTTFSLNEIVDYFDTIVFGSQLGPKYAAKMIATWQGPVGFSLQGEVSKEHAAFIQSHIETIAKITDLEFKQVDPKSNDPSISLIFVRNAEMGEIPVPMEYRAVMKSAAVNANCYFLSWKKPESRIVKAMVVVDVEKGSTIINSCLLEHLAQSLGLPNNSDTFRPSIFSDRDHLLELAPQDKILLHTLYHPDMKSGFTREQANQAARAIISRMANSDNRAGQVLLKDLGYGPGQADGGVATTDGAADIVVRAKSDSWIQIRDGIARRLLVTRRLRAGDSYLVPDRPGMSLLTGNAGALEILVGGKAVPSIGGIGAVRRNVALDAERLRSGTAVID